MPVDPSHRLIVEARLREFLAEDVRFSDVSSTVIPAASTGKATIAAKGRGIACGIEEIEILFSITGCTVSRHVDDGNEIAPGDVVATISGPVRAILLAERTALNVLMLLSGVATTTRAFQAAIERGRTNPRCRIAATRKTIPGMRTMQKRAVQVGGGDPHRWSLDDMVLLKDTHRAYFDGDIAKMLDACRGETPFSKKIEVEVETIEDAVIAARHGADIIMLDNMTIEAMTGAVKALEAAGLRDRVLVESSGNVTLESAQAHASTGVDLVSTSAITLKVSTVDFSLELS